MIDVRARMRAANRAPSSVPTPRRGPLLLSLLALSTLLLGGIAEPVAADGLVHHGATELHRGAAEVIAAARHHLGAPYVWATDGPRTFDCSGLVYRAFKEAREAGVIGGTRKTAAGYMLAFERRGQASRTHGRPGDLVVYGHGSHIGIYLGNGMVISALTSGVRRHGLRRLTVPFTEFLHTHLSAG